MSIFSNWGKNKSSDADEEKTQEEIDAISEKYDKQRKDFEESLKVDVKNERDQAENRMKADNPDDDDDEVGPLERSREHEDSKDDDENIR